MAAAKFSTDKLFTNKSQTALYAKFRPKYSPAVFETIFSYCKEEPFDFELAIDVGCGSGQGTVPLTKHFKRTIGIDPSEQQIANAPKDIPNLSFHMSHAEELGFTKDSSVDLVTVAQAFHWMDQEKFYKEVDRVLKPGGCLVLYGYGVCQLSDEKANKYFNHLYNDVLAPYWAEGRRMVEDKYSTVILPYPGWRREDSLTLELESTVDDFVGYLGSWSAVQSMQELEPSAHSFLDDTRAKLKSELGETECQEAKAKIKVIWPVFMLMGRKPLKI